MRPCLLTTPRYGNGARTYTLLPDGTAENRVCSEWHSVKHKGSGRLGLALLSLQRVVFPYDLLYEE